MCRETFSKLFVRNCFQDKWALLYGANVLPPRSTAVEAVHDCGTACGSTDERPHAAHARLFRTYAPPEEWMLPLLQAQRAIFAILTACGLGVDRYSYSLLSIAPSHDEFS